MRVHGADERPRGTFAAPVRARLRATDAHVRVDVNSAAELDAQLRVDVGFAAEIDAHVRADVNSAAEIDAQLRVDVGFAPLLGHPLRGLARPLAVASQLGLRPRAT